MYDASFRFAGLVLIALGALSASAPPAAALEIRFDYRYDADGFFDAPTHREILERAAWEYTSRLRGTLTALPQSPYLAAFPDPSGSSMVLLTDLEVPSDTLIIFVGTRSSGTQLAVGSPGETRFPCFDWLGEQACFDAMRSRGDLAPFRDWISAHLFRGSRRAQSYPPTEFATWGGALSFSSDVSWYAGRADDVPPDRYDLLSAAIHEIGHVLGVGTAESWGTHTRAGAFSGDRVVAVHAGSVALEGDGSHWAAGTRGPIGRDLQEAAFGPYLPPGARRWLTDLDVAALADIGWRDGRHDEEDTPLYGTRRLKGDVDADGVVDGRDAELVRAFLAAEKDASFRSSAADIAPLDDDGAPSGDGELDERDVSLLEQIVEIARIVEEDRDRIAPFRLQAQLLVKARRVFQRDPFAALRLAGWHAPSDPWNPRPGLFARALPPAGDADGDGLLTANDVELVLHHVALTRLADPWAYEAADVAPMLSGTATGDGRVDAADVALLERAAQEDDLDGDGISTREENLLNELVWMPLVGRPRYEPLTRWTEACLDLGPSGSLRLIVAETGGPSTEFCSRDGTPWSRAASLSPEELDQERRRAAQPDSLTDEPPQDIPMGAGSFPVSGVDDRVGRPPPLRAPDEGPGRETGSDEAERSHAPLPLVSVGDEPEPPRASVGRPGGGSAVPGAQAEAQRPTSRPASLAASGRELSRSSPTVGERGSVDVAVPAVAGLVGLVAIVLLALARFGPGSARWRR